ncbi:MAG TPA: hypothetical protein VHP14_06900 [Anaerolineales bacterium]|nr:hypothetical protein [Anaerolineales bacterium]
MAELRCSKCGKSNPDLLDVCQFCGTPLKPDSILHIGQVPTKMDTGELEATLPKWLKDVRQQAMTSEEGKVSQKESQPAEEPRVEKEENPDFLAGLASQTDSADDDIPDWLASISPAGNPKPVVPSTPEPESDFFAQFRQIEEKPVSKPVEETPPTSVPPAVKPSSDEDDLSKWFSNAAEQPDEFVQFDEASTQEEAPWARGFEAPALPPQEPAPKEQEDLSWLHNLEDAAKQTGDLQAPQQDTDWMAKLDAASASSQPSGSQEDLSWLDSLGGIAGTQQPASVQPFVQSPSSQGDDLSWLNNLGGTSASQPFEAAPEKPASAAPFTPGEDLSWLSNLGGATTGASQPAESAPAFTSQDDLSWLSDLGTTPGEQSAPPFVESEAGTSSVPPAAVEPDWLKSALEPPPAVHQTSPAAMEPDGLKSSLETPSAATQTPPAAAEPDWLKGEWGTPSTPASADTSMDWFGAQGKPAEEQPVPTAGTAPVAPQPDPFAELFPGTPGTSSEPASLSSQDVDSLFSVEMPDWLSRSEPAAAGPAAQEAAHQPVESDDSLAPVDLPSWVQAMRPVEAVISETAADREDEPEEKEGPLAGLRGVLPGAAIGLSKRPKPVLLKLQATSEQQAGADLLEKILASETNPRALIISSFITSQRALRWTLTALFLLVLSAVVGLRSQIMPISSNLSDAGMAASNAVDVLPASAKVLVVVDYEPSLAGEMEVTSGPLLDQVTVFHNPQFSFISTSPTGPGLVERLVDNTGLDDLRVQYDNLGFLPGGSTGVLGFVENPVTTIPTSGVEAFSDYDMVVLMTDHAESGRVWIEQLYAQKRSDLNLANKPLIVIASAQAGPLLQPYLSSGQISGMVSGLSEAARYEYKNGSRPGIARSYWDAFGVGLMMAVVLIFIGSIWSLITGIRARRAEAEQA